MLDHLPSRVIKSEDVTTFGTNLVDRITNTTADGKAFSIANCRYITTTKVPDDTEMQYKLQLLQLQMKELQIHTTGVHNTGGGQVRATGS